MMDISALFMSNFSRFKDILDLEYTCRVLCFSIMGKTHIEIETLWGKSASYICNHTIICHRDCLPAARHVEGLADDHHDRSLWSPAIVCTR